MEPEVSRVNVLLERVHSAIEVRQACFGLEHRFPNELVTIKAVVEALKEAEIYYDPKDRTGTVESLQLIDDELSELELLNESIERALGEDQAMREASLAAHVAAIRDLKSKLPTALKTAKTLSKKVGQSAQVQNDRMIEAIEVVQGKLLRMTGLAHKGWESKQPTVTNSKESRDELYNLSATLATLILALRIHVKNHGQLKEYLQCWRDLGWCYRRLIQIPAQVPQEELATAHAAAEESLGTAHLRSVGGHQISSRTANRYQII